jgi:IS5 family transposase
MSKRQSRYVRVAQLAYALTQKALPAYSHAKSSHRYTQPQLAACVLLAFYCNLSYRDFEEWLLATEQVCQALDLSEVPDHSTVCRMFNRLPMKTWRTLFDQLLADLAPQETTIAADTTGYRATQASAYFQTRSGRQFRDWYRGAYAVGTKSQLILAACQSHGGSANDARFLRPLRRGAARFGRAGWLFLADAGYDCRAVRDRDIIPPIRRGGHLTAPARKARADLVAQARLDGLYGQRWKTETVHSVIKRKFGDHVRSRSVRRQCREPIVKALLYNLHR